MTAKRENFVKAMVDDSYGWAMEKYDEEETIFDQLFEMESSDGAYEQYTTALGPTRLTETAENETISQSTAIEGYTVYCANKKFATELPISNEAIDDNQKVENFLKAWAGELGEAARNTKEEVHALVFNKGGFTAGHQVFNNEIANVLSTGYSNSLLCYDGKPFFTASGNNRAAKNGATYYNGVVSLDLDETNLQVLTKLMATTNAKNEAGRNVSIVPNIILVKLFSDNWWTAKRIVESAGAVNAAHAGVANLWKGFRVVGWPFLDDADAWYIGRAKKGLVSLSRTPLAIDYYENKSKDGQVVRAKVRLGCAVKNWRNWAGANFAQS